MKDTSGVLKILVAKIEKTVWLLGLHAFVLILFFIFIDFIIGGFIFYKYVLLAEKEEAIVTENIIKFNDEAYNAVLAELQKREQSNQPPAEPQKTTGE